MREQFEWLLQLSAVDKSIFQFRETNKNLPIKIGQLEKEISTVKEALENLKHQLKDSEQKIEENKQFMIEETENLNKSNERLTGITTNKEYEAIHSEIATHKKNIEDSTAISTHRQQVLENLKKELITAEDNYNKVLETNSPDLEKMQAELSSLEDKIAEEEKKTVEPRKKISKRILSVYDRIMKHRNTPYIISVINWESKVCDNCNRTQPPQKIHEVSKGTNLINCESCGSILVWSEQEKQEA